MDYITLDSIGSFENIGVDKKTLPNEKEVLLLNYVNVYHNKYIDSSIPNMIVTASDRKIIDCNIKKGDIFITPTSETVDDIGHSAVVIEDIAKAVYSYHIMRFRMFEPNMITAFFVNYMFDTISIKQQILKKAQGLTRFGLSKDKFGSLKIPMPSLTFQKEIVEKLDSFTSLITNLEIELGSRQKQYEFYRNKLLTFDENDESVEWKTLGEVCNISRGKRVVRKDLAEVGTIPVYQNSLKPLGYAKESNYPANTPFVISAGAAGEVGYSFTEYWGADDCFSILCYESVISRFVFHWLKIKESFLQSRIRGGAIKRLSRDNVDNLSIPIPTLQRQREIVSILDTFESLITNIKQELDARKKQYEYYREKLLTFE